MQHAQGLLRSTWVWTDVYEPQPLACHTPCAMKTIQTVMMVTVAVILLLLKKIACKPGPGGIHAVVYLQRKAFCAQTLAAMKQQ